MIPSLGVFRPLRWPFFLSIAALVLSSCVGTTILADTERSIPTATPPATTPAPTLTQSVTPTTPTETPTQTFTETAPPPTPTEPPRLRVGLITADASEHDASVAAQSHLGATNAATAHGFDYERIVTDDPDGAVEALAAADYDVIILVGENLAGAARRGAGANPDAIFVGVDQTGAAPLPANFILLGGDGSRQDQLGFVAGVMAGLATETLTVGSIVPAGTVIGKKYATGYLHGVRLTCGDCEHWPIALEGDDDPEAGSDAVARLQRVGVDAFFAAPSVAGEAALRTGAEAGMWVVSAGRDYYASAFSSGGAPSAERVLPSPVLRADLMLEAVLDSLAQDSIPESPIPFSYGNGTLDLALTSTNGLTPAEISITQDVIARLTSGQLGTGVDPVTGEAQ